MKSKITGGETEFLFKKKVLNKYDVSYYKCLETGFIQTETPFWLDEAYSSAISSLDVGLVRRNISLSHKVARLIYSEFKTNARFIDYGGGYGLFVRLMRDIGFDFYLQDTYAPNLFAKHFEISDLEVNTKFELLTAFEVFEHLVDPISEIEKMLGFSKNILFSTEIQPLTDIEQWWYFVPLAGQHVSLYTLESLEKLAKHFNLNFYTNNVGLHLFTSEKLKKHPFIEPTLTISERVKNKLSGNPKITHKPLECLIDSDFKLALEKLQNKD